MFAYDDSSPDSPFLSTITINTDGSNNIASGQQRVITFYPDELRRIDHITDYYQAAGSGGTPPTNGHSWYYNYDGYGDLVDVTGPTGLVTQYIYSSASTTGDYSTQS